MTQDELNLLHGYLQGTLDETGFTRLQTLLRESALARKTLRELSTVEAKLEELAAVTPASLRAWEPAVANSPAKVHRFTWSPFAAAAAGLIFGLFSASMVWGYVGSYAGRVITLVQESFESGPAPSVTGMPIEPGRWSGDYSEVVGEFQGVKPASGQKMLRFLRADYEGKPIRDGYVADLFRIIDLRGSEFEVARGDACVSVEARFRSLPQDEPGRIRCGVTVYALDALPAPGERHDLFLKARDGLLVDGSAQNAGTNILATASRHEVLPVAGGAWQIARNELRLPPGARFFMIHLHESLADLWKQKEAQPVEFAGLFVDDIRVTLTHRPPLN